MIARASARLGMTIALASAAPSQVTHRVSVDSTGAEANGASFHASISADGRYVAFTSDVADLVPGDTNGHPDVFVRDRLLGTTERVSVDSAGAQGDAESRLPRISASGRYVAFESLANNLASGGTFGTYDVFLHDRRHGTTELVSLDSAGTPGNAHSFSPSMSADGRYVAFWSNASNLVPGDTNLYPDVFVRDRQLGLTERVSLDAAGAQGNRESWYPSISADGRHVAFFASATNLVAGDTNDQPDVFLRDRQLGATERVSLGAGGAQGDGGSSHPSISADGRYVQFTSGATNLVPGDNNGYADIFLRDRLFGATQRVNLTSTGSQAAGSSYAASISGDGRYVVFASEATNLVPGDDNGVLDVFLRDRPLGVTERVSLHSGGAQGDDDSFGPAVSGDGRCVVFSSAATQLVPGDTNGATDVFVRDRLGGPSFTSLCHPGVAGVIACPCANPPSGPGRGCDNSAGTGGAVLTASGGSYLSSDSLVFATSGEKPSALSLVTQWSGPNANGLVAGQGVRCTSGAPRVLYAKSAVGGGILAPDFSGGDLPVSARSAALGEPILAGQSRWYFVHYRDPIVLGGCPSTSTFNTTQTGAVTWLP